MSNSIKLKSGSKPRDRNKVVTVDPAAMLSKLSSARHPSTMAMEEWHPQVQFIVSNQYYEKAALAAMEKGSAVAAAICPTGLGGWSVELQYAEHSEAGLVIEKYNEVADSYGLY